MDENRLEGIARADPRDLVDREVLLAAQHPRSLAITFHYRDLFC
jgi:hypothetical protein